MELVFAIGLLIAAALLLTVALTGSTFRQAIAGQANTTKLHTQPGA